MRGSAAQSAGTFGRLDLTKHNIRESLSNTLFFSGISLYLLKTEASISLAVVPSGKGRQREHDQRNGAS